MQIGFLRNQLNPTFMAKLTAILCKNDGHELIYLRPRDITVGKDTVQGKVYKNHQWIPVEAPIPKLIDISALCYTPRTFERLDYLRKKSYLTENGLNRVNKEMLQTILKDDPQFSHLVIPSMETKDEFKKVLEFVDAHGTIVMKPMSGLRGKGIFIVKKERRKYRVGHYTKEKTFNQKQFLAFFEEKIKGQNYLMQKYVESRTAQGDPFDCRIHVEKNGKGEWVVLKKYIRIGIGQKVISNVNQGGGIADTEPFLKANFGDAWEEMEDKLDEVGRTLPYKYEELRKTKVMTLGLDVGINRNGDLHLFEVNSSPATDKIKAEVAMMRTEYYRYLIENVIK